MYLLYDKLWRTWFIGGCGIFNYPLDEEDASHAAVFNALVDWE